MKDNTAAVIILLGTLGALGAIAGMSTYASIKTSKIEAEKRKVEEAEKREFDRVKNSILNDGGYIDLINRVSIGNDKLSVDDRSIAYELLIKSYRQALNADNRNIFDSYMIDLVSNINTLSSENELMMTSFIKAYSTEKAEKERIADIIRGHKHELEMVKCKTEAEKYIAKENAEAEKYKVRETADVERYKLKAVANAVENTAKVLTNNQ